MQNNLLCCFCLWPKTDTAKELIKRQRSHNYPILVKWKFSRIDWQGHISLPKRMSFQKSFKRSWCPLLGSILQWHCGIVPFFMTKYRTQENLKCKFVVQNYPFLKIHQFGSKRLPWSFLTMLKIILLQVFLFSETGLNRPKCAARRTKRPPSWLL